AKEDQYDYLKTVRYLAWKCLPKGQNWEDSDDLIQEAVIEIVKTLPTERGSLAEKAWTRFCQNCFIDAWRKLHGRRGERLKMQFVEPFLDKKSGETVDPIENTEIPWIKEVIKRTVANIADPLIRRVAEDRFGPDPSPISSGRSTTGKP